MNKILFITNDFGPRAGGIESFMIGLIENLPKNSVLVYTSSQRGSGKYDRSWLDNYGVEVIRDRSKVLLPTPRVARAVNKVVARNQVQIACFGAAAPLALLSRGVRRAGAARVIAISHGHEVWWARVFPFTLALRRIGDSVDALTYLGKFTRREISKALSARGRSVLVQLAPGIDVEHFRPRDDLTQLRSALALDGLKVVVSVGRLVKRKGQDRLIEAMPLIQRSIPNAHLLIVGEGRYGKYLKGLAGKLGVSDAVTFVGRVSYSELPKYFSLGEVFAMPGRSRFRGLEVEGLGIVYLEAGSCGLPVIAGKSGGAPDAIIEGRTGLVVDGKNVKEISEAIIRLLADPESAMKMGAEGRSWAQSHWSWRSWSERFAGILEL